MVEKTDASHWWPALFEPLRAAGQRVADWFAPRSEAATDKAGYEITIELPGVQPDDIELSMHDGALIVRGEKRAERRAEGRTYFFSEREYGAFQRSFRLPADADPNAVEASHADGVLTVSIPRRADSIAQGKRIAVKRG